MFRGLAQKSWSKFRTWSSIDFAYLAKIYPNMQDVELFLE
jgi:hypothetical protein